MMTARLSTQVECENAIREGARLEDCGRELNGFDSLEQLDRSWTDVDDEDVAIYAHALELESVSEWRHARVEAAYLDAQWEGIERWRQ
jgi:hypothetical protein